MSQRDILLIAEGMEVGTTDRIVCPVCKGGQSGEKSLSITQTGEGPLYHCFRATCSVSGGRDAAVLAPRHRSARMSWDGPIMNIPASIALLIADTWGISPVPDHWYFTDDYGGRIAMSIRTPRATHRGWVLRQRAGRSKALTFINEDEVSMSWYKEHPFKPTYIVEDMPSAVRTSRYANSVALLGTGVGLTKATEISEYATRPIVIALDQDATAQAFKIAKKYALLWGDVKVLPLKKDLKNLSEEALCQLLK